MVKYKYTKRGKIMNLLLKSWSGTSIFIFVVAAVLFILGLACLIYKISKYRKIKKTGIEEIDNTRYTTDSTVTTQQGDVNVTYNKEDLMLAQNVDEVVGKDKKVKPGKYTILSTQEGMPSVNIRIGHYVREYKHGSTIVLVEGEKITPVSSSIILR